jgi:hypothetical protein
MGQSISQHVFDFVGLKSRNFVPAEALSARGIKSSSSHASSKRLQFALQASVGAQKSVIFLRST